MTVATVQKPGRSNLDYDSIAPNFFFFLNNSFLCTAEDKGHISKPCLFLVQNHFSIESIIHLG